jgi:[protein-PII] uridylyltransferase
MPWTADIFWGGGRDSEGPPDAIPGEFLTGFMTSMPSRYRVLFDPRAIQRHAAVAYRRAGRPAFAELWRSLPDGSAAMCVVADDRPGLLSAIAAALISHRLDVITALVFSRVTASGDCEAVDLIWVRRARPEDNAAIDGDEAISVGEVLNAILSGAISVEEIAARTPSIPPNKDARVEVRFLDADEGGLAALFVEAPDRPGMLLTITLELFQQGAQIVRSLVRTSDGRAYNQFELAEFSGAALSPERREQVRAAVYGALALADR